MSKDATVEVEGQELTALDKLIVIAYCKEMTATLQYQMAYHQARGNGIIDARDEYTEHMKDEFDHAAGWLKRLEERRIIIRPDYKLIQDADRDFVNIETSDIKEQIEILIRAEEGSRDFYGKIVNAARDVGDWITERIAKEYMAVEERHACDLRRILEQL